MSHKEILDELRQPVRDLRDHIPAVFEGYGALSSAAFADGALGVAIVMNGGPGTVHAPRAFEAFQEFTKK